MKFRAIACRLSVPLLLVLAGATGRAAPFSAELVHTRGSQTTTGTFHYQDRSYRFDLTDNGQQLIVIFDGQSGVTRLLAPSEKSYVEAGAGEPMSLLANPFAAYAHLSKTESVRPEGTESVGGVPCQKQVVFSGEQVMLNAWVSDEFDVPLKVQIPAYEITVELKNLQRGPQDAALFALPAGYKLRVEEPEAEPQPDWVGQVAKAPLLTPPCEKTLAEGDIIRLRTQAGRWISVEGTNTGKEQGSFTTLPFKGGKSPGASEMATTDVDPGDSGAMTVGAQPDTADELAVRVGKGSLKIKAAYVAPRGAGRGPMPAATEPASPEPAAAESALELSGPAAVDIAARFEVSWKGPGNAEDFISVAQPNQPAGASVSRTSVREGSPLKLWAPSDPGEYEIRYVVGRGANVLAKTPLTVNAVAAAVEPPAAADVAARIEVNWQGPAAEGDFISVALPKQPPGAAAARALVRDGNPAKLWLPGDAGQYEIRYILGRGARLLAKAPITVNPVTATVEPPASAKAGSELEIHWQGPGYPEDFISVARAGQPPNASVSAAKVRPGGTLKLRAPREPGAYEVRYVLGRGPRLLAKVVITIEAP